MNIGLKSAQKTCSCLLPIPDFQLSHSPAFIPSMPPSSVGPEVYSKETVLEPFRAEGHPVQWGVGERNERKARSSYSQHVRLYLLPCSQNTSHKALRDFSLRIQQSWRKKKIENRETLCIDGCGSPLTNLSTQDFFLPALTLQTNHHLFRMWQKGSVCRMTESYMAFSVSSTAGPTRIFTIWRKYKRVIGTRYRIGE